MLLHIFPGIVALFACFCRLFVAKLGFGINIHTVVLIVQLVFQGSPSKEVDSAKESSGAEKPSVFSRKRNFQTAMLQHKKPASSVNAEIIGGPMLISSASSKGATLRKGILLCPKK